MALELLAPICKTEKRGIHSHGFFPPELSFPALDVCVDRLFTEAFLPWLDLVCPLLMQVCYSSLPVLPPRRGGDAPGVDLMTSQTDLVPCHQDLSLIFPFLWCHSRWSRVAFRNVSQASTTRGSIVLRVPMHIPEYGPDCSRNGES